MTNTVAHVHQAPCEIRIPQKVDLALNLSATFVLSSHHYCKILVNNPLEGNMGEIVLTPRTLPPIAATIPDRKEPKARERTENHTMIAC